MHSEDLSNEVAGNSAKQQVPGIIQLPGKLQNLENLDRRGPNNAMKRNKLTRQIHPNRPSPDNDGFDKHTTANPVWYQKGTDEYNQIHNKDLIDNLVECDHQIQELFSTGVILKEWDTFEMYRKCLQKLLQQFLTHEMKFCAQHIVENHFWKLLYYNVIEMLRRCYSDESLNVELRNFYKDKALNVVEEGLQFFEQIIKLLQDNYKFSIDDYIGINAPIVTKGLKYLGLALVSTQRIFLCLGDLNRYRELINETGNYGAARQWYTKAQQVMPSNGRPYYQLGVLSVYSVSFICGQKYSIYVIL